MFISATIIVVFSFNLLTNSNSECQPESSVNFNELKLLTTSLPKEDILEIYKTVINKWHKYSDDEIIFVNPFTPIFLPMVGTAEFTNYQHESLPEDLSNILSNKFKFVIYEDICVRWIGFRDISYTTITKPNIFSNGTVTIQIQTHREVVYSDRRELLISSGNEYSLIKTTENKWNITTDKSLFIFNPR